MNLHKYAVVLHNYEDLNDFYNDMETEGGTLTIPNRAVDVDLRKPKSRVTHYMLTPQEASEVGNDTRVEFVELVTDEPPDRMYTQTGQFSRNSTNRAADNQWGLWRHISGENNDNFDANNDTINGTVEYQYTGRNVDVVILDDQAWQPDHTEFEDENGNSRVVDYNWWQHAAAVGDTAHVGRTYAQRGTSGNFHNIHCAGTVAGKNEGWAKDANIYFFALNFSGNDANNSISTTLAYDYIREFHNNKPINPDTGYKNPTIVNNSWGYSQYSMSTSSIASVTFDGTTHTPGGSQTATYNGYYGAYSTSSQIVARAGDPENSKNRFTTTGTATSVTDRMVAWPDTWDKITNQTFSFNQSDPADNYEITVLTPCDVKQNSRIQASCNSEDSYMIIRRIVNNGASIATTVRGPEIDFELTGGFGFGFQGPTGNVTIRYIVETYPADGDEFTFDVAWTVTTGERGQFFSDFDADLEFEEFTEDPETVDPNASGSVIAQPFVPISSVAALTADSTPSSGNNDDGYWTLSLPFSVQYLGNTYSTLYVGTNSLIMFGAASSTYLISSSVPAIPKIMIGARDRRGYSIWYGTEGTAPNREFRIVWEGNSVYQSSLADPANPAMRWEIRFFENATNEYEITWEQNGAQTISGGGTFTSTQLQAYGYNTGGRQTARNLSVEADIVDAIADGIIVVASAGNGYVPMYSSDHPYYNNYLTTTSGSQVYYHRPQTPAGAGSGTDSAVICVGALANEHLNNKEQKVYFSNFGENVDIFAAGHYIQSAMPDASSRTKVDRGSGNYYSKVSGTSMSGPQVCGVLACMLEQYPDMTQRQARELLRVISKPMQMYDDPAGTFDFENSLEGAANLVLWMPSSAPTNIPRYPRPHRGRPRSGVAYPRRRIRRRRRHDR